ncbi:NUDIX domain-containing protein [Rhodobium gokarnense]|uniref:GDP-mannose pyrophosphatase n=1 Tax=Rhodobium gokarnense TaxID=364296 RepID=A0ABT3HCC8_9HYPH|nr:NUDIX domain-containing protein [Rhodobium gokarnense]MCW2308057.1 nudix-type nucleoside diphosphatase (YffH/AdpP family) [Rhodobium gokarnense]
MEEPKAGDAVRIEDREVVYRGFVTFERMTVTHPARDGSELTVVREVHDHGSGVCVLPVDPRRRTVLLVRQFRVPVYLDDADGHLVEVCAGLTDEGDADPETTARREAAEELGYDVTYLSRVGYVYSSPGIITEKMVLFLAEYGEDSQIHEGGGLAHEGEDIEVLEWTCDQLRQAVVSCQIRDAKTVILAQALMLHRPELFS